MKLFIGLFIFTLSFSAHAVVWNHDPDKIWNDEWQKAYATWVATSVTPTFFKDLGRPFSRIKMDCADAQYALRAYFSREHKLPFRIGSGKISNMNKSFDKYKNPDERLAAFITYIAQNYSTETLVHSDTFPVALNGIFPGDVFMYKVGQDGNFTRHTYIIKNINPDGTFDVLYSTQANAAVNGELKRKTSYMFKDAPKNGGADYGRWGFRRMKPAQYAEQSQEQIPGANFDQYRLARELSSSEFFRMVKKLNQTIAESPQMIVNRHFTGICTTLKERIDIVNKALVHQNAIGGACMNFADYDAHSTPSRDQGLMKDYEEYQLDFTEITNANHQDQVEGRLLQDTYTVFNARPLEADRVQLYESCPIQFGNNAQGRWLATDLSTFRQALFQGRVSFHPNDNIYHRWGQNMGPKTTCEEYYGYPE